MEKDYIKMLEKVILYQKYNTLKKVRTKPKIFYNAAGKPVLQFDLIAINYSNHETFISSFIQPIDISTAENNIKNINERMSYIYSLINDGNITGKYFKLCPNCKSIVIEGDNRIITQEICDTCVKNINEYDIYLSELKNKHIDNFIYLILNEKDKSLKIGISKEPEKRLKSLQTANSAKLTLLSFFPGGPKTEKTLHKKFNFTHEFGEWFKYDDKILEFFNSMVLQYTRKSIINKVKLIKSNTV